ncbi:hypothetical protein [Bacillus mesophilum]|uniref:Transglycosylase n=1 Tax=Bacillus mesophilum TaxID=1071718 RepID=A0A7V7UWL1_9BACI|nr:hypothetical protein [Bacillus mesophilum]KAB2335076.1 hypothetical protein F7732_00430 [Bacillus mesophilum]
MTSASVNCDKCKQDFKLKSTKKKMYEDGDKGKVFVHYFSCPHCHKKYPTNVESDEINELVKRQKVLKKKIPNTVDLVPLEAIYKEMDDNAAKIKSLSAEYKMLFNYDNNSN